MRLPLAAPRLAVASGCSSAWECLRGPRLQGREGTMAGAGVFGRKVPGALKTPGCPTLGPDRRVGWQAQPHTRRLRCAVTTADQHTRPCSGASCMLLPHSRLYSPAHAPAGEGCGPASVRIVSASVACCTFCRRSASTMPGCTARGF